MGLCITIIGLFKTDVIDYCLSSQYTAQKLQKQVSQTSYRLRIIVSWLAVGALPVSY